MPGSAVLDPAVLVDSLVVDVIDGLRGELHPQFGVRPFRVYTLKRTWSGTLVGEGIKTDVVIEILPAPLVTSRLRRMMTPAGVDEVGETVLTEVSLTYTYTELTGGALNENQQWLYRIDEGMGQGNPQRFFMIANPPVVDRDQDMGWKVSLKAAGVAGCNP